MAMRISVEVSQLLSLLQPLMGVIDKKHVMPVMGNVLVRLEASQLTLIASDGEIEFESSLELPYDDQPMCFTVPARKLLDICRNLSSAQQLTLSFQGEAVSVTASRSRYKLSTLPAEQFPRMQLDDAAASYRVKASDFAKLLQHTAFAMANQDVRFYLNGLLLSLDEKSLTTVATDGHRLALSSIPTQNHQGSDNSALILPRKAVTELCRLLAELEDLLVQVVHTESYFSLSSPNHRFITKRIVGKYPNYHRVIPQNHPYHLAFDSQTMKEAIAQVVIMANEKSRGITVKVAGCQVVLDTVNQDQEYAMAELEALSADQDILFSVNASYLTDVLNALPLGTLIMSYHSAEDSLLITTEDYPDAKHVIMPMKI